MTTTTTTTTISSGDIPRWADLTGRILLAVDAVLTLGAFGMGIPRVVEAGDPYVLTEFWRTTAYLVFAGLWALLALAPRRQRGLWELILLQKTAVTVFALAVIDVPEAVQTAVVDGYLVVSTVTAYVLCRGWRAWRTGADHGHDASDE